MNRLLLAVAILAATNALALARPRHYAARAAPPAPSLLAVSSSVTTISGTAWTDLGVGPYTLAVDGSDLVVYLVGDTLPTASLGQGIPIAASGSDVQTGSHVWVSPRNFGITPRVIAVPLAISVTGGGGGGGAITAAAGSYAAGALVDGASVTFGTKADAPCSLPASTTPCSLVGVNKALANAASGPLAIKGKIVAALTNTPVQIGTATSGNYVTGIECGNTTAALAWVQVWDAASTPTPGPNASFGSYPVPPNSGTGGFALGIAALGPFASKIYIAGSTGSSNNTSPGASGLDCTVQYVGS